MATGANDDLTIVRAREEHLESITELAASRSLQRVDMREASKNGFLVSGYTVDVYRTRLSRAEHFYVALKGVDIVGFVLAYSDKHLEPEEWLNNQVREKLGHFLVIKQVCVSHRLSRQGVASRLYSHVLDQWDSSPVIAAVVSEPPNDASTQFHRRHGFQELTRMTPPDGKMRVVWVRRRRREMLAHTQYEVAVDLYKHEDNTNWQKLNNFFYVTAGLAAATAFALSDSEPESKSLRWLAIIIAIIGVGASIAFAQMLLFGRRYLQERKAAVIDLERYLFWHGGDRIVDRGANEGPRKNWLRTSPTGMLMVLIPSLVAVCWVAILIIVVMV